MTTAGPRADEVADRVGELRRRIASAAPDPARVAVVAVTKGFGPEAVRAALAAGISDIGENYASELLEKAKALTPDEQPVWHFLGAVQRNKVARLAPLVSCWQSVSRREEGSAIAQRRPGAAVLVQVDIASQPGRLGQVPEKVPELVAALRGDGLDVRGLMAIGPPGLPEASRAGFRRVAQLADELDLPVRSLGMSDDLEVALTEGSTMVRVGRALFGDRPPVGFRGAGSG